MQKIKTGQKAFKFVEHWHRRKREVWSFAAIELQLTGTSR
jgi:hypothetical protein